MYGQLSDKRISKNIFRVLIFFTLVLLFTNKTFAAPINLSSSTGGDQPDVAVDSNGNVHIVYTDNSYTTTYELYYTMLDSDGNTLIDNTLITSDDGNTSDRGQIAVDSNDKVQILFRDFRDSGEIYYTKLDPSLDDQSGDSANAATITEVDDKALTDDNGWITIFGMEIDSSNNIHVIRNDYANEEFYYFKIDSNGDELISRKVIRSNSNNVQTESHPTIDIDSNGNAHMAWSDLEETSDDEVYYAMVDGSDGSTLIAPTLLTPDDNDSSGWGSIAVDYEDKVYIAWDDTRAGGTNEIYYTKLDPSLDDQSGGAADASVITEVDDTLLTADDSVKDRHPNLSFDPAGEYLHMTWEGNNDSDIYYMVLNTYLDATALTTSGTTAYRNNWTNAHLFVEDTNKAHVVWGDNRTGSLNAYYDTYTFTNNDPNSPTALGPSDLIDGSFTADNTPTLEFTLSDDDASDTIKYQVQIDDSSGFTSPIIDYTSALAAQGSASFTVGQAEGSGSYTTGNPDQNLSNGDYYWRVRAIDSNTAKGSYSTANSGSVAFKVDATTPNVPSGLAPDSTPTTDSTPTWTWTASPDSSSVSSSESDTTDTNFNDGTHSQTNVTGSGTDGSLQLELGPNKEWHSVKTVDTSGPALTDHLLKDSSGNLYWSFGADSFAYLYRSTDNGSTWTSQKTVTTGDSINDDYLLEDSSGNLYWSFASADNKAYLYRSTDGGVTWSSQETITTGSYLYTVHLLEDSSGDLYWSFGGFDNNAYLYRSTDGGVTWSSQETVNTGASGSRVTTDYLLEDSSGDLYWSFGSYNDNAYLYRSTDGGATWASQETVATGGNLETVHLSEDLSGDLYWSFGGASNNAYLYRSTDGGATWASQETIATAGIINADYLFEDSSGNLYWSFANGYNDDKAYLYRSTDGGATWASQETVAPGDVVYTVHLFEDSSGNLYWSFGANNSKAQIYRSTDGGATWSSQKTVTTEGRVRSVHLLEDSSNNLYWSFTGGSGDDAAYLYGFVDVYYSSGTFISRVFNTGQQPSYTTLEFSDTEPADTEVKYQLRSASTEAGVSGATWYGPSSTSDYYTSSATNINSVHDDDQYIQYKAIFSATDVTTTPVVDSITVNYDYDSYLGGAEATSYTVQWCADSGFSGCGSNTSTVSTTTFTHSTSLTNGTWYARVKALDDAGNESAYSSNSSVEINAISSPSDYEIEEPESKSYTNDERPEFVWTVDSTAVTYDISVDNGDDGDFEITGISATGSGTTETSRYEVKYEDDKITFQTKSSDSWGDSDNDGELKEGEREVTITATDSGSNEVIKSKKFYVDRSGPSIEIENVDGDFFSNGDTIDNPNPSIKVKVIDELNGETEGVASGPESGEISIQKRGILGLYSTVVSSEFDFDETKWNDSGLKIDNNKKNDVDKYGTYTLNIDESLSNGDYKIIVTAQDNVGNESEEEFKFTVGASVFTGGTEGEAGDPEVTVTGEGEPDGDLQEDETRKYEVDISVKNQDGDPLSGAIINIGGSEFEIGEDGSVFIEELEEGIYNLKITYKNQTREQEVVLSGDVKRQKVEITLPVIDMGDSVVGRTKDFVEQNSTAVAVASGAALSAMTISSMFVQSSGINIAQLSQYTGLFTEVDSVRTIPLLVTGFLRRKKNPWGVVYDAKNKQPLDPAIVTLTAEDGTEHQSVTDMYGRYEFLVGPGKYKIDVKKTSYKFPAEKVSATDLVYSNVLTGKQIEVSKGEKVQFNIPMDRVKEDWNQLEKMRMGIKGYKKYFSAISAVAFWVGLLWSLIAAIFNPITINFILFGLFAAVLIFRIIRDYTRRWGVIKNQNGNPLNGVVIELQNAKYPQMSPDTAVTDEQGRYNFLVEKGSYKLVIKDKNYESDVIRMNDAFGSIGYDLRL